MPPHCATQGRQLFPAIILQLHARPGALLAPVARRWAVSLVCWCERRGDLARAVVALPIHSLMDLRGIFLTHSLSTV